jgi:hypothetical protein
MVGLELDIASGEELHLSSPGNYSQRIARCSVSASEPLLVCLLLACRNGVRPVR